MSAGAPQTTAGDKSGKGKLALLGLVVALAALAFVFLRPSGAEGVAGQPVAPVPGEVVEVGQMTVNLADPGRYARVAFSLVLAEGVTFDEAQPKFPLVKEAVLFEVSKVSAQQLREAGGLDAIAADLSARAREVYPDGEIVRLVLTELLIQ